MEYKTIIESVKDYIMTCPYIADLMNIGTSTSTNTWFLEEGPNHKENISTRFVDGTTERVLRFSLTAIFNKYDNLKTDIEYSGFYEKFQTWIESHNNRDIFPTLRDGIHPISMKILTTGYFINPKLSDDKMKYQIQLQFIYEKENEQWIA